jgi:hypothetical protein
VSVSGQGPMEATADLLFAHFAPGGKQSTFRAAGVRRTSHTFEPDWRRLLDVAVEMISLPGAAASP